MKLRSNMMKVQTILLVLLVALVLIACGGTPADSGGDDGGGNQNPPPPDNTEDTTPPTAPSSFSGSSGDSIIELTWDANNENDLEGYNLYRSQQSFSNVSSLDPMNGSTLLTATEFTDEDVQNGTTYYYRVTAVDESGNESSLSSQVEITPFSNPPSRPKNR